MNIAKLINWKLFWILLLASIFANIAVLPYASSLVMLRTAELPFSLPVAILLQMIQATIFFAIAIFIGLFLAQKVGLGVPLIEDWVKGEAIKDRLEAIVKLALGLGVMLGISLFVLDRFVFSIFVEPISALQATPPLWQRFSASFYGGIAEEIGL